MVISWSRFGNVAFCYHSEKKKINSQLALHRVRWPGLANMLVRHMSSMGHPVGNILRTSTGIKFRDIFKSQNFNPLDVRRMF